MKVLFFKITNTNCIYKRQAACNVQKQCGHKVKNNRIFKEKNQRAGGIPSGAYKKGGKIFLQNRIISEKEICVYPFNGHDSGSYAYAKRNLDDLKEHG